MFRMCIDGELNKDLLLQGPPGMAISEMQRALCRRLYLEGQTRTEVGVMRFGEIRFHGGEYLVRGTVKIRAEQWVTLPDVAKERRVEAIEDEDEEG